jgi:hypothetical protein
MTPRVKKPPAPLERVEQSWLVRRLRTDPRARGLLWSATANGMPARSAVTGALMVAQGMARGVPDLLFFEPKLQAFGLAIEMKRRPNQPTAEQREWLTGLEARGWQTHVAYSAEEAWTYICDYFEWIP